MNQVTDEQAVFKCAYCRVPILTFWDPNGGGLERGEYVLAGDIIFHPRCFGRAFEQWEVAARNTGME